MLLNRIGMRWVCVLFLLLLKLKGGSAEPPGPWEPQHAILAADIIVRGFVEALPTLPEAEERNAQPHFFKLHVTEVLHAGPGKAPMGRTLDVLLSSTDSDQRRPTHFSNPIKEGSEVMATLIQTGDGKRFMLSSPWPDLSLLPADRRTREHLAALLKQCTYRKADALQAATNYFGVATNAPHASVIGGTLEGTRFRYSKNTNAPDLVLVWKISRTDAPGNLLLLDTRTGRALQLVKERP